MRNDLKDKEVIFVVVQYALKKLSLEKFLHNVFTYMYTGFDDGDPGGPYGRKVSDSKTSK